MVFVRESPLDKVKTRVPRNIAMTKEFAALWRPEMPIVGTIAHGLLEAYYLSDVDLAKDSNSTITTACRTLQLCKEALDKRGMDMPQTWRLHSDNTASETKNQINAKFASHLVFRGHFAAVDLTQYIVGHTTMSKMNGSQK